MKLLRLRFSFFASASHLFLVSGSVRSDIVFLSIDIMILSNGIKVKFFG